MNPRGSTIEAATQRLAHSQVSLLPGSRLFPLERLVKTALEGDALDRGFRRPRRQ